MVAITVVLAGVLVAYLNGIGGTEQKPTLHLGVTLERTVQGNWTVSIVHGSENVIDTYIQVTNATTGMTTLNSLLTATSYYFVFNDNTSPNKLNAGDSILLNQTAGIVQTGFRFSLVKGSGTLAGPIALT